MPRYEVEFILTGTTTIDAPGPEYVQDIFHDKELREYADTGDVEIKSVQKVDDYDE